MGLCAAVLQNRPRSKRLAGVNPKIPATLNLSAEMGPLPHAPSFLLTLLMRLYRTLFLADQTARHIDPAVGTNHTGDPDAILVLACGGPPKLERRPLAERGIGCL